MSCLALFLMTLAAGGWGPLYGQLKEPPVRAVKKPVTPVKKGVSNRLGGGVSLSNFGIEINGAYGHVVGPYTQLTFSTQIGGIRYASQQSIIRYNIFYGAQKYIPNKYNRAMGFPFLFGVKRRIFPKAVSDNFRFFLSANAGPALALVYPYLNDKNGNGYRDSKLVTYGGYEFRTYTERKKGFFGALGHASTHWGAAGSINIGIDFGSKFKSQPTFEVGYFFYYFNPGMQLMYPYKPVYNNSGDTIGKKAFFDTKKYFGTPQITFKFSGWW